MYKQEIRNERNVTKLEQIPNGLLIMLQMGARIALSVWQIAQ